MLLTFTTDRGFDRGSVLPGSAPRRAFGRRECRRTQRLARGAGDILRAVRAPQLSYANVTATLALFIALGGTSYAVTQLPRNSVGNRQLKANAVTSSKIRSGAVARSDLAASLRDGIRGPRGPAGPTGAEGAPGPSETIQVRPEGTVAIPGGARSPATVASFTLAAGSWLIDGRGSIVHAGPTVPFDCFLKTAAGTLLGTQTAHVGSDAPGATAIEVAIQSATELAGPTQILFTCQALGTTTDARVFYPSLLATRVGRIDNR